MSELRRSAGWGSLVASIIAACCLMASAAHALTQDLTGQFAITRSGLVLNRATNTFDSTITLRNTAAALVLAPIDVAVGGLPAGVALANKAGDKPDGRPYVSPMAAGAQLASGASLQFVLKFANPARVTFNSTLQVLREVVAPVGAPALLGVVATGGTNARLLGRVEGAANQDVTLQFSSASACVAGTLVSGAPVGSATVRTDDAGYFGADVAGVNPGAFVTIKTAAGSPSSLCQVSSRDNDSWPKAFLLGGTTANVQDLIDVPGKARWYKFAITPGQRIDIRLTGLPADYDLAAFKDIGEAFASQFNPATAGPSDLLRLTAEYAPSTFSPSTFSPSTFSPSTFSPDAYNPSTFSPSTFSSSVFSPSTFSPSTFSPSTFSPSTFSPSTFSPSTFSPSIYTLTEVQQAFSTAQTRSIVAISATPGLSDEATVVNTWNRTGHFYVRVTGRNGAFDTSTPFTLNVTKGVTTCTGVTDTALTPRSAAAATGLRTILLTDSSRLALDAPLTTSPGGTLRNKLAAFAARPEISGVVVDVAGDSRVGALKQQAANNPACPFAKNLVAEEIKGIVDSYRANPLQFIVIVGNDDTIPFFRSPDQSVIGKESGYVPPVQSNSPSEASLRRDFVLSQDKYGSKTSISLPWNDFPVPGLAVGRLIETAGEIAGLLDAYVGADAVVSPRTSLVTGYDFLEDAANAVKTELDTGMGGSGDALITPNGVSPQAPASWKADQLRAKLFGPRRDVIFLAGHFSANSALAADFSTSVLTTELAASTTDFENSIVFSAGCHSGYNLVDGDSIPGVTLPLDWAQAFARKKATLVAGTGYQYGDTDFLEYSERLYSNFARQLRAGSVGTSVAIGEALVQAKLAYLAATPDIRGLHEKALLQATLFGLPMLGVNMPSGRGAIPGTSAAVNPTPVPAGPAATLGLETFDLPVVPSLGSRTQTLTNLHGGPGITATWLSGADGVVAKPGEPALPLAVVNVTPNDSHLVLRGIGYRGGNYADAGPMVPLTGAATTESRGVHVAFLSPVFYPSTLWTPNYFGALAGNGGTQLLITPVQHKAASVSDGTSTQRRHTAMNLRLFYSGNTSQAALSDAPSIIAVDALADATGVTFSAQVVGDPAAAIYQVWVTFTGDGANAWTSLDLSQCVAPLPAVCGGIDDSRLWKGRITGPPANLKYFVQAANGLGLVARNDNFGAYFGVGSIIPTATTLALVSAPSTAIVGDSPAVTARLTYAGGVGLGGKTVAIGAGGTTRLGTTAADGSVSINMPVVADPGAYLITAAFAGDGVYQPSSASAPLTINRAAATPTVLPPGAAVAGVNISGALGGTSTSLQQVPVTFTVVGPGGTTSVVAITDILGNAIFPPPSGLPPGNYTVTGATFGGDGTYAPTTITFPTPLQVSVPKLDQSIGFDALAARTFGDADFDVFASASSGLGVSYGASGNCTIGGAAGNTVHLTGTGNCTITASQAGNATYNAAEAVMQSFTVNPGAPVGPTVVSIARSVPSPTMADSVTYTVTFSEAVNGVTVSNFLVGVGGINGGSVIDVSGTGSQRTVTVDTGRGTGILQLFLNNPVGITSIGGTPLAGTPPDGETFIVDKGGTVIGGGEGQPVAGFGVNGYALFSDDPNSGTPGRIRVRSDGTIMAAGGTGCGPTFTTCVLQLAKYTASGAPDPTFGTNGRVVTAVTNIETEVNLFLNGDGTIIVLGVRNNGSANVLFAAKFLATGAPDTSFGTNGLVTLDSLPLAVAPVGKLVEPSGKMVFAATTRDPGTGEREDIIVVRLTSAGVLDTTFDGDGVAQFAFSAVDNRSDRGTTLDILPDGRYIIGGRTKTTAGLGYDFVLMRLTASGALDPTFGVSGGVPGIARTHFPSTGGNFGRRLVLQPDGKVVLVGGVATIGDTIDRCGIARFGENGDLDPTFGNGGRVLIPAFVGCFNVNQQSDGKIVVVGQDQVGDVNYGMFMRLLLDGSPDPSFGNGGILKISGFSTPSRVAFVAGGNMLTGLTVEDPADGVQKTYVVELGGTLAGPYLSQTITFDPIPDKAFGDFFTLPATASSGLPVTYTASGTCSVAGSVVQLSGLGSCTITAHQTGNATWFAATSASRTFAIAQATQVITFGPAPSGATAEQLLVTITASSASPNAPPSAIPLTFTSLTPSVCTWGGFGGSSVTLLAAGTCTIAANQAGNAYYSPAPQATQSFAVGAAVPPGNTYLVSNTNDSGPGSLRDAINQANAQPGANAISFFNVSGTITLTTGSIQISGPLLITGPGADQLTIDGNAANRIFAIGNTFPACPTLDGPDYLVSISGLRLTNGRRNVTDSSGGAIYTEHSLALDAMVIDDSAARAGGGVMFSIQYPGQSLTVANSRFIGNRATELVPATPSVNANSSGGALYVVEKCANALDTPYTVPVSVSIANSEFRGNGATPTAIHGRGGAIRSYSRADIVITDTAFVENYVDAPNPPVAGRVYHGGAFEGTAKSLRIERSEISDNSAYDPTGSDATRSGGLHMYNSAANLQGPGDTMAVKIVNSTISRNTSSATAGAMLAFGNLALELSNVTSSDNEAAPTRTGGLVMSAGDTYPSGSITSRPRLTLVSSILANSVTGADIAANAAVLGAYTIDASSSLIETLCATPGCPITVLGSGNLVQVGAVLGPDPILGPLAYHGGPSRTHALLPGSPAINAGSNPLGLANDQRGTGFARANGVTDMGAYESGTAIPLGNFAYSSQFGSAGSGNGQFNVPVGVAIDPTSRNRVVVDSSNHRVQVFSAVGAYLSQFGSVGSNDGQFSSPYMVAIDPINHRIVVSDLGNNRIQIFSSAGAFVAKFGSSGSGDGQFNQPNGVAIDPANGNIVVADRLNHRVQRFSASGAFLGKFGSLGSGDGQLNAPNGVAIDPSTGYVIVADTGNNRVQIFDSDGAYLTRFGSQGSADGQLNLPSGIAIDPESHNIIVADSGNNRVQVFDSAGGYLSKFGTTGAGNGQFSLPYGVAIDPVSHDVVVVDENNNRVQTFAPGAGAPPSSNYAYASQFGTGGNGNGQFALPYGIAINPTNNLIAVTDYSLRRVQIFSSAGSYVSQFGSNGTGNGQFAFPTGLAFDATNGNIVVADSGNDRVQVFSSGGAYVSQFGTSGTGAGQMDQPYGVAVDPVTRNIVVTDGNNRRVQLWDSTGSFLGQFGSNGTGNGQFFVPFGVAIDPTTRDIVVSDFNLNRVQIFNSGGAYLGQFGSAGSGNGQFNGAAGVAIDPTTRNIFVTDYNNQRIQVFSSAGVYLSQFGTAGSGNGQFSGGTYGVAIDPTSRNAVVTDVSNIRVQIFAPQ